MSEAKYYHTAAMSAPSSLGCVYCSKDCKKTDSRPYPNSRSTERIHIRCQIKKTIKDKTKKPIDDNNETRARPTISGLGTTSALYDKIQSQKVQREKEHNSSILSKIIIEKQNQSSADAGPGSSQFFFDVKAGIAKPHEKRRYLTHRNISEIAARYDDQGFQNETVGRSFDHTGKDLSCLGDNSNSEDDESVDKSNRSIETIKSSTITSKRKNERSNHSGKKPHVNISDESPCWFCLSSSKVEKHLIVAIGEYCYLTLAKGGLVDEHFLIAPIEHIESLTSDRNSHELYNELEEFKKSLKLYFGNSSRAVVFYERNFKSVHWQLQAVPVDLDKIDSIESSIKEVSKRHFNNSDYINIPSACAISDVIPRGVPYLYWQLEPPGSKFVTEISTKGCYFPVQLARCVLADPLMLDCMTRVDWKNCVKSREEYTKLVKCIKEKFKAFDFT